MRIIKAVESIAPSTSEALFEKAVSTLTETRVIQVYADAIDAEGNITRYTTLQVVHYPKAKYGETIRTSLSTTHDTPEEMRAAVKEFFTGIELAD